MNNDPLPVERLGAAGLPPPPALQRVALPPDYQRAYDLMGMAQEAAIPVARLAEPVKPRGASIARPVLVAVPVPVSRPAPNAKTEPIARPVALDEPVAIAIAEPVAVAVAVAVAIATLTPVSKPAPAIRSHFQTPKVATEESRTLADPSSRLW